MLLFFWTKVLNKSIPVDLQATVLAVEKMHTCSFPNSQYCICEQITFFHAKFLKSHIEGKAFNESVKNRRIRLRKTPQTEKNPLDIFQIHEEEIL